MMASGVLKGGIVLLFLAIVGVTITLGSIIDILNTTNAGSILTRIFTSSSFLGVFGGPVLVYMSIKRIRYVF